MGPRAEVNPSLLRHPGFAEAFEDALGYLPDKGCVVSLAQLSEKSGRSRRGRARASSAAALSFCIADAATSK
jgi:hypothetical protein